MKPKQEIMEMTSINEATLEVLVDIRDILAEMKDQSKINSKL